MKTDSVLAKVILTTSAPRGYKGQLIATAKAYHLSGNTHPYFSVTGDISTPAERARGEGQVGGCIHEEILKVFPVLVPLVNLHLSNADDGAVANGFYHLAGSVAHHFGEQYHAGNSKRHSPIISLTDKPWQDTEYRFPTEAECLASLAEHLRISIHAATAIRQSCLDAYSAGAATVSTSEEVTEMIQKARAKAGNAAAKKVFADYCDTLRPQWAQEAKDGIALIHALAAKQEAKRAQKSAA